MPVAGSHTQSPITVRIHSWIGNCTRLETILDPWEDFRERAASLDDIRKNADRLE
jgi:hypothetical protein